MSARRRGLGRGLDALIKVPESAPGRAAIGDLHRNEAQPRSRFDDAALAELADSIKAQGLVQPIVVTPRAAGGYTIIAGERRWRAAERAGLDTVPIVVREVSGEQEMLELALVENLQRSDLDPIEEASAYRTLGTEFGLSQSQIALRVGKGRPTVSNALRLLKLPLAVQELLAGGQITAGQARPLLRLGSPEEQERLARRAAEEGLSAREIERFTQRPRRRRRAKPKPVEPHAAAAAETLTRNLQTKVEIVRRGKGGVITIHFHSEEELMRLYDRIIERTE